MISILGLLQMPWSHRRENVMERVAAIPDRYAGAPCPWMTALLRVRCSLISCMQKREMFSSSAQLTDSASLCRAPSLLPAKKDAKNDKSRCVISSKSDPSRRTATRLRSHGLNQTVSAMLWAIPQGRENSSLHNKRTKVVLSNLFVKETFNLLELAVSSSFRSTPE